MEKILARRRAGQMTGRRMRWVLLALSAVLLLAARVRPGLAVTVNGERLGVYAPHAVSQSLQAAEAAAGEILGRPVDLREHVQLRLCLTAAGWSRDSRRLERALLSQAPGVERLWVVKAGEQTLGAVDDPTTLGELVSVLVGTYAGPYTVAARLEPELRLERSFVRTADVLTTDELSRRLQEAVAVETQELDTAALPAAEHGIVPTP